MALVYFPDFTSAVLVGIGANHSLTLKQCQAAVGGFIELVQIPWEKRQSLPLAMVVNEEGRLQGLPSNPLASHIAGQDIRGPALLVTVRGEDWF